MDNEIVSLAEKFALQGIIVIVNGLDKDFKSNPFQNVDEFLIQAERYMNQKTKEALETIKKRVNTIDEDLQLESNLTNIKILTELNKERSGYSDIYDKYTLFLQSEKDKDEAEEILNIEKDEELKDLAKIQLEEAKEKIEKLEEELNLLLLPKDPNDDKNVIFEIRGAAGGDEGNIFAGDLFRMYSKYAEKLN
ncbi:hypothetical protein FQR65_LT19735 [Abscondita terminalis]|nr:hypothetical protein FQR65_LT19735 [Abscondita terminalis]